MSKHTPGPWAVNQQTVTARSSQTLICHCPKDREDYTWGISRSEAEANARLIAAAPDLLRDLKMIATSPLFQPLLEKYGGNFKRVFKTIAKAEGKGDSNA